MSLYEKVLIQVENVESEVDSFNESRSDVTSFQQTLNKQLQSLHESTNELARGFE
jgi:ABC-type transporter Mla subunit MlaD